MISEKIKSLRESHNMTQSSLAKTLGVTRSGVNAWEMGISVPSTHYIVELAKYFDVSTDYLLGREETPPATSLPLPGELLKIYHGKSVWSSDFGWVLVNSIKNVLVCVDGSLVPFDNAGSVYVAQPPFYEASLPDSKPLSKPDLQNYGEIWLEPISHDTELREQLRGTYRVYEHWVENNFGNRFSLGTYGVKWLAFSNK